VAAPAWQRIATFPPHKIIYGRYGKGTAIITTDIDFKQPGDDLGAPVITTATVDR
jgi:hypothetical protein